LSCYPPDRVRSRLSELLDETQTQAVQVAAVHALADDSDRAVADILLDRWQQYLPTVRAAVLDALLSREPWTLALLQADEKAGVSLTQLDSTRREMLLKHRHAPIATIAGKLFGTGRTDSLQSVVADYQSALNLDAESSRGSGLFRQHCTPCHKIG